MNRWERADWMLMTAVLVIVGLYALHVLAPLAREYRLAVYAVEPCAPAPAEVQAGRLTHNPLRYP